MTQVAWSWQGGRLVRGEWGAAGEGEAPSDAGYCPEAALAQAECARGLAEEATEAGWRAVSAGLHHPLPAADVAALAKFAEGLTPPAVRAACCDPRRAGRRERRRRRHVAATRALGLPGADGWRYRRPCGREAVAAWGDDGEGGYCPAVAQRQHLQVLARKEELRREAAILGRRLHRHPGMAVSPAQARLLVARALFWEDDGLAVRLCAEATPPCTGSAAGSASSARTAARSRRRPERGRARPRR